MNSIFKNTLKTLMLAVTLAMPISTGAADKGAKVVYHVDFKDPTRYSATLTSINNIIDYYDSELMETEVHLVFVGYGLRFTTNDALKGTAYQADKKLIDRQAELKGRLQTLIEVRDVQVHLCDKTRKETELSQSKIYKGIQSFPSGVAKIAILQSEGFAYLKVQ